MRAEGRRWAGWVAAALVAAGLAAAAPSPDDGPAPKIRFDATTHDFGELRSDTKTTFRWTFHNDGTAPLKVLGTRPSCGCTATVVEGGDVAPGGQGALEIVYDPAGQQGSVRKSLAVSSNDPAKPVVLLTLRAHVTAVALPVEEGGHPSITGQSLLMGSCAGCHAAPAAGKRSAELYTAVCGMCHGPQAEGGRAPSLRGAGYLEGHDDRALAEAIAYGTADPRMPGFSDTMGGPLDDAQVASLVALLRAWGPAEGPGTRERKAGEAAQPAGGREGARERRSEGAR